MAYMRMETVWRARHTVSIRMRAARHFRGRAEADWR
jgi:hypothetical protein